MSLMSLCNGQPFCTTVRPSVTLLLYNINLLSIIIFINGTDVTLFVFVMNHFAELYSINQYPIR